MEFQREDAERLLSAAIDIGEGILCSGGEVQRVFLAQLFAQDPQILILDEPANHLDLPFQKQIFDLTDAWRRQGSKPSSPWCTT